MAPAWKKARNEKVNVRLTDEEFAALESAARASGWARNPSEWARFVLLRELRLPAYPEMKRQAVPPVETREKKRG